MPTKTTVLDGFCASGDCECFCFDKRTPDVVRAEHEAALDSLDDWTDPDDGKRVYPDDILPKTEGRIGRWVISVSFSTNGESGAPSHFVIDDDGAHTASAWRHDHDKKHPDGDGAIGGRYTYSFTPTTLGVVAKVTCACGESIDLTNYEEW